MSGASGDTSKKEAEITKDQKARGEPEQRASVFAMSLDTKKRTPLTIGVVDRKARKILERVSNFRKQQQRSNLNVY